MRALLFVGTVFLTAGAAAQTATPSSHWGSITLPELGERYEVGVHFIGFTQYGKETTGSPPEYTFNPYNEIDETLGFNALTYTRSGRNAALSTASNDVSGRTSLMVGVVDDRMTEWLQNTVVHWSNLRRDSLARIPRELSDTFAETSLGPTKSVPLLGLSQEYVLRLQSTRRAGGRDQAVPTPFFVGGGATVSTVNHEAFVQGGANVIEADLRPFGPLNRSRFEVGWPCVLTIRSVGVGGMARAGVIAPSAHFDDLTASYTNVQAVVRIGLTIARFPAELDIAITSAEGYFVRTRTPDQIALAEERGEHPRDVYASKTPVRERFVSLRFRSGGFSVETYNDVIGGQDKGPSFGVGIGFEINKLGWRR